MSQLQHRGGKYGKIVLKHHPLDGLVEVLEPVEAWPEVQIIMPGVITSVRGRPIGSRQQGGIIIKVQYIAPDGHIRLLAKSANSTQEIRVLSSDSQKVLSKLQRLFPV